MSQQEETAEPGDEGTDEDSRLAHHEMGFVFKRVDDNTTKVDVYEVVGTDTLASSPEATVELKRRK